MENYYRAITFYMEEQPMQLNAMLNTITFYMEERYSDRDRARARAHGARCLPPSRPSSKQSFPTSS